MSRSTLIILALVVVIFVGVLVYLFWPRGGVPSPNTTAPAIPGTRATPVEETFHGCVPQGRGGDPMLNLLKNRVDQGNWQATSIANLLALRWPSGVERRAMSRWSAADRDQVAQNNGLPVQTEGYLLMVRQEGAEATNCGSTAPDEVDFHMWMAAQANDDRAMKSVVIEVTPRVRAKHPAWTLANFQQLAREDTRVRISGWTMLDPEHPDEVHKSRGTIWEIHPVMEVEAATAGGSWREL